MSVSAPGRFNISTLGVCSGIALGDAAHLAVCGWALRRGMDHMSLRCDPVRIGQPDALSTRLAMPTPAPRLAPPTWVGRHDGAVGVVGDAVNRIIE